MPEETFNFPYNVMVPPVVFTTAEALFTHRPVDNGKVVFPVNGVIVAAVDSLNVPLVKVKKLVAATVKLEAVISKILLFTVPMFTVILLKRVVAPAPEIVWLPFLLNVMLAKLFPSEAKFNVPLLIIFPATVIL